MYSIPVYSYYPPSIQPVIHPVHNPHQKPCSAKKITLCQVNERTPFLLSRKVINIVGTDCAVGWGRNIVSICDLTELNAASRAFILLVLERKAVGNFLQLLHFCLPSFFFSKTKQVLFIKLLEKRILYQLRIVAWSVIYVGCGDWWNW